MNTKISYIARAIILVCMVFFLALTSKADDSTKFNVVVKDSNGEGIPGVRLVLTHLKKQFIKETITNKQGVGIFDGVILGKYDLLADKKGFGRKIIRDLTLKSSIAPTVNVLLDEQPADRAFTDISVNDLINIFETVLQDHGYLIGPRLDFKGEIETGWKSDKFTVKIFWTGERRKMYKAYIKPDPTNPTRILFDQQLIVQVKEPVGPFREVDVSQESEDYCKSAYEEGLRILQLFTEMALKKGGKIA